MDVNGGQVTQTPLNPVFPGTRVTGPLLAGNILRTGGANQAGLGSTDQSALANVGYAKMTQVGRVTQLASAGQAAGVFASPDLVIPAQSLILSINTVVLTAWGGAASTFGIGTAANPTFYTPAGALSGAASETLGIDGVVAPNLSNWLNTGNQDTQLVFTSSNSGVGVAVVIVEYVQGVNAPTA